MDGKTLMAAMTYPGYDAPLPLARYTQLVGPLEIALKQAKCTTVPRISMFLAQIGAETGSLRWTEELASGADYNGRVDLGNTHAGDGPRFKGRSFIQITGRAHYAAISKWAHGMGYVPTATYFIDHPQMLADDKYAFLGPVYYWTVARNMNSYADRVDIRGGTYAVNGGYNNLAGRTARWNKCLSLGSALLPTPTRTPAPTVQEDDMAVIVYVDPKDCAKHKVKWPGSFLLMGRTLSHIATSAELKTLKKTYKVVSYTYADYRQMGGK